MSRWFAVPIVAVALVACGGDDDSADEAGTALDAVTTTAPATTEPGTTVPATTSPETTTSTTLEDLSTSSASSTTEPTPTTTPATTAAPTTAPPTTTGAPSGDCLVGNWVITEAEMNGFYDTIEGQIDTGDVEISITGQTLLDFTADTFRYTPAFTLTLDVVGQSGEGVTSGSVGGTYVGDDGLLTTTLTESNLDVTVTVMGQTFNGNDMANGMLNSFPIVDSPYTCGPNPTIMFKTSVEGVRHPVTLTPA